MNLNFRTFVVSLMLACTHALAEGDRLVAGSTVPALNPKHVARFALPDLKRETGCAVVVFWNSTEGPSRQAISVLNRVLGEHGARGLEMVAVSEEDEETITKLSKLRESVPLCCLASDKDGSSKNDWLTAAKLETLPRAFVVGRGGRVLWIGSPLDDAFEGVVRKAMTGRFDPARREKVEPLLKAAQKCAELRNFSEAYKHYTDAIDVDPGIALDAVEERYKATLLKEGNAAAANAWLLDVAKRYYGSDPAAIAKFIEMIVLDPEVKQRSLETADQLVDAMGPKNGVRSLAMQAMLANARGDAQRAIDLQSDAWLTASPGEKPGLRPALDEYRAAARRKSADGAKSGG